MRREIKLSAVYASGGAPPPYLPPLPTLPNLLLHDEFWMTRLLAETSKQSELWPRVLPLEPFASAAELSMVTLSMT